MSNKLIVLEGLDGSGKSTLAVRLSNALGFRLLREPGSTTVGEKIRDILLDDKPTPKTEALLFAAARNQLVHHKLLPYLAKDSVILDRYWPSSIAYQAYGLGLGESWIKEINATYALPNPDIVFVIDPLYDSRQLIDEPDEIEHRNRAYYDRVSYYYRHMKQLEPDLNVKTIGVYNNQKSRDKALKTIIKEVKEIE